MSNLISDNTAPTGQPGRKSKRPTIVYLTSEVAVGTTSMAVWSGVATGAEEHDVNLIGCAGGNITEGPANIAYDLVTPQVCLGIVTWSMARVDSDQENEAMHARYQALPVVTVSRAVAGYPVVMADNYKGMREAITHLIETHGCRRLAFIRGPEDPLAEERHRAYLETLEHYDIPFNPALVTPLPDNGCYLRRVD